MIVLRSDPPPAYATDALVSPLNALWTGALDERVILPQIGHMFLVCPLEDTVVSCAGIHLESDHYLLLTRPPSEGLVVVEPVGPDQAQTRVLLLLLSPDFIADMADFLNIPAQYSNLLHAVPLLQGDAISRLLQLLAATVHDSQNEEQLEELFMEVVGQVLRLLRLRYEALLRLARHKTTTVDDLLPRLLRARQFIEARYLEPIKTQDVAGHVTLSEYHFARLFRSAFDVTVHQYVLRLRLDEARHLLELSETRITDIALTVGYTSLSAFINAFRRRFGVSPSQYRSRFKTRKTRRI